MLEFESAIMMAKYCIIMHFAIRLLGWGNKFGFLILVF